MFKHLILFCLVSSSVFAGTSEASFTPDYISVPIDKIEIAASLTDDNTVTLYSCSDDDCLVDVTDEDALNELTESVTVKEGSYNYLIITACDESEQELTFKAELSGVVTLDDGNYYTSSSDALAYKSASEQSETVEVLFDVCTYYFTFQEPLEVDDTSDLYLTLFMDNTNIAWGRQGAKVISNGCFEGAGDTLYSVCMGFPLVAPIIGTTAPTVEEYRIFIDGDDADTAGGSIFLMVDDDDVIVGGFARRYFSEDSIDPEDYHFYTAIKEVTENDDGSYSFETFGTSDDDYYLYFSDFERDDHTGTYYDAYDDSYSYEAELQ